MSQIVLNTDQYLELEKITLGAYAPLRGFMNESDFLSVIETMRLKTGELFPIPLSLDMSAQDADKISGASMFQLVYNGDVVGEMVPESIFTINKPSVVAKIFGVEDPAHPGIDHFFKLGEIFVGGPVTLTKRATFETSAFEMTPAETKAIFKKRGWKTIAAFHTRNIPHRAHEWLQRLSLDLCDGLFIHPIIGRKKAGDFTPKAIMTGYKTLIEGFYPEDRVLLAALSTPGFYAGPREAVFHALIRRNYGCTHIVIGRDHAGVGDYYDTYASQKLCQDLEQDLGITIMAFTAPHYCKSCDGVVSEKTCPHMQTDPEMVTPVSGTEIRALLADGKRPEPHIMRPKIVDSLNGIPLFT